MLYILGLALTYLMLVFLLSVPYLIMEAICERRKTKIQRENIDGDV